MKKEKKNSMITFRQYLEKKGIYPSESMDPNDVFNKIFGTFITNLNFQDAEGILDNSCLDEEFEEEELDRVYELCVKSGYIEKGKTRESCIFELGKHASYDSLYLNKRTEEKVCKKCGKNFTKVSRFSNPIYNPYSDDMCCDCFMEEVAKRDLTEKEITTLLKDRRYKESYAYMWQQIGWPEGLTKEHTEVLDKRYKELLEDARREKERKVNEEYRKVATTLIEAAHERQSGDLVEIVVEILKYIDDRTKSRGEIYYK